MPRNSPYRILLSSKEKAALASTARKYTLPHFRVVRAKAILLAAAGLANNEIGERLGMGRDVVSKWRKRFFEERLDGLHDRPRAGRPASFSPSGDR